ncbi:hypothetical protein LO772_21300 [Yinghuangia sp. ASG 101]|uniref:hypothetical protein n=1 Tax=Yinghuangia sp. ASG 101 TaxID=2896848 RepID=UPI001E55F570|nr:hypothetical protein [Yinghuangia sp. ASG 101]UGQ09472.1 hypothetical protein LO772_21300 [Yinghuangia sp. ASG 101]
MGQRKRSSEQTERSGILGWAVALLVVLGLFAGVAVVVVKMWPDGVPGGDECTVRAADGKAEFDPDQAANAATIAAVGQARGLPERAVTIAIATSIQESKLFNITYGDRDSLGLFQQRPSQGWGTAEQIQDPVYSAGKFYDGLVEVPNYLELPLTVAAQTVQRSAYPEAYAQHEAEAQALAAALTGGTPGTLSCRLKGAPAAAGAGTLRASLTKEFAPVLTDKAITEETPGLLTVRPGNADGRGWAIATWAVARASELGIREIAFDGKVWTRDKSGKGWRVGEAEGVAGGEAPAADPSVVRIRVAD